MTFVPVNFDDVQEAKPATPGKYALQVTQCQVVKTGEKSKNPGRPQYKVTLGFKNEENVPNITHYISLPHEDDEPGSATFKALLLKRFLVAFNVPFDNKGFDIEGLSMEMLGSEGDVEVGMSEPDDNGSVYNRLVLPRLPSEQGRGSPPTRRR